MPALPGAPPGADPPVVVSPLPPVPTKLPPTALLPPVATLLPPVAGAPTPALPPVPTFEPPEAVLFALPAAAAGLLGELLLHATLATQLRTESAAFARPQVKAWSRLKFFMRSLSWDCKRSEARALPAQGETVAEPLPPNPANSSACRLRRQVVIAPSLSAEREVSPTRSCPNDGHTVRDLALKLL